MKASRVSRRRNRAAAVLLAAVGCALVLSACQPWTEWFRMVPTTVPGGGQSVLTDPSQPSSATDISETTGFVPPGETSGQPPTATTPAASQPDDVFDQMAEDLILLALDGRDTDIILDPLFEAYRIPRLDADTVIDRLYQIYQTVYLAHPRFFYLNGSAKVSYTSDQGDGGLIHSMSLTPQYWESTAALTSRELDLLIHDVELMAEDIATQIRGQTSQPWRQLQLLHDWLVRNIIYDRQENQEMNHAAAALLDGTTLCQGYAQAFQLIGLHLGFDVQMVTGESDGIGHAWNLVRLDGTWYHVDVTHDDPLPDGGDETPARHIHFLRSDAIMAATHQWDRTTFPAAPEDGAHYYRFQGLTASDDAQLAERIRQALAGHDFSTAGVLLIETLLTGTTRPSTADVEAMLEDALSHVQNHDRVYYRLLISKDVVFLEISLSD